MCDMHACAIHVCMTLHGGHAGIHDPGDRLPPHTCTHIACCYMLIGVCVCDVPTFLEHGCAAMHSARQVGMPCLHMPCIPCHIYICTRCSILPSACVMPAATVKAYCKSAEGKSLKCGWASADEQAKSVPGVCLWWVRLMTQCCPYEVMQSAISACMAGAAGVH